VRRARRGGPAEIERLGDRARRGLELLSWRRFEAVRGRACASLTRSTRVAGERRRWKASCRRRRRTEAGWRRGRWKGSRRGRGTTATATRTSTTRTHTTALISSGGRGRGERWEREGKPNAPRGGGTPSPRSVQRLAGRATGWRVALSACCTAEAAAVEQEREGRRAKAVHLLRRATSPRRAEPRRPDKPIATLPALSLTRRHG